MSDETLNMIVGFGGVFLLGVIGFLVAWFSAPREDPKPRRDNHASSPDSAHGPAN